MKRVGLVTAALVAAVAVWGWSLPSRRVTLATPWSDGSVRGLLHVHSQLSDGRGSADDIAVAAARAGLQFVVLTDHGDGTRRPEAPAYRAGVLVIDGVEVSTRGGHYVAIALPQSPYPLAGDAADVVEDVRRMGGFGIVAHPDSPKAELRWTEWSAPFDAVELINPDTSWRIHASQGGLAGKWLLWRSLLAYPARPVEAIAQLLTDTDTLRDQWSTATAARKVVALAGADAHAKVSLVDAEPGNNRYSVPIPSYESSFASLSVHVRLDQPFSGEAPADAERLIQGLRSGAVFVAVDGWASPAAFEYWATEGALRAEQGGSLAAKAPVSLHVRNNAPDGYRTIVWKDHKRLEERTEREFELPVGSAPAVYSIEVRRDGRGGPPWVISNPVYVGERDAHGVGTAGTQPTANRTARLLFDGRSTRGWSQEGDSSSAAALGIAKLVAGDAIHLRYGLAGGAAVGQFVAAAVDTPEGVDDASGVRFRVHASADMRFALQVRADGPEAAPERWERSVFITPNDSEHFVRFADMTPVGAMRSTRAPLSKVRSVLFVVDTTNTKPGASGQIWLSEVRLVRE